MPRFVVLAFIQTFMACYRAALALLRALGPRPKSPRAGGQEILLTGAFYSNNWIASHLTPLAMSRECARLRVVSTFPIQPIDKLELIVPPSWLRRLAGDTVARLLTFFCVGLRTRPDIVGGFHLLLNGLLAQLLARMVGARAMYFCVGGPAEVLGGGIDSENRLFERLRTPSQSVERQLVKTVAGFDLIVTMGTRAKTFFESRGVRSKICVVSGGLDASRYFPASAAAAFDMVFVGRLAPIKRVDLFLQCTKLVASRLPHVKAVVVGDGKLRQSLEQMAQTLGIASNVTFVGQQANIEDWLRRSRLFLLTSDSEGLSLALIEAMLCGLPAIVSDVGDLGDLVEQGANGYLVGERSAEPFAARVSELLENPARYSAFAQAARSAAERYELNACAVLWGRILVTPT